MMKDTTVKTKMDKYKGETSMAKDIKINESMVYDKGI